MKEEYIEIGPQEAKDIMLEILKEVDRICIENNIKYWLDSGTLLGAIRHDGFIPWDDDIDVSMLREDFQKFLRIAKKELKEDFYLEDHSLDEMLKKMPLKVRYIKSIYIEKWDNKIDEKHGIYIDVFPMDKFSLKNEEREVEQFPKYLYQLKTMRIWDKKYSLRNFIKLLIIILLKIIPNKYIIYLNKKYYLKSLKKNKDFLISYGYGLTWRKGFLYEDIFPLRKLKFEGEEFFVPNNSDKILRILYGDYMKIPDAKDRLTHSACIMLEKSKIKRKTNE